MRIKVTTQHPLEKHFCWFPIEKKLEGQAIYQLTKQIVKKLELQTEPTDVKLLLEGCLLLPQTKIKSLLRDGDAITVRQAKPNKPSVQKRKPTDDLEEQALSHPVKKVKTSTVVPKEPKEDKKLKKEKKKAEEKKKVDEKKKQLEEAERQAEEKKKKAEEKERKKAEEKERKKAEEKERKKAEEKERKKAEEKKKKAEEKKAKKEAEKKREEEKKKEIDKREAEEQKKKQSSKEPGIPFDGLIRTKKRNMRRRLLKQAYQNQFNTTEYEEQSLPAAALKPLTIEAPEPKTIQPSKTLLKKNKNKKKNHLTDPKADNQVHIHYEDANWDQPPAEPVAEERNHHGRAFISYAEADSYYKGQPHETEYPIHRVPTLFYAEDATVENNTVSKATAEVDYENLPDADFKSKIPAIGDQLAIKTLELTANYSPEISEWKQVVLRELNLPETVTVEFKQGFYHNQTKGGKFDNKAHERRDYDDYFYQQEEEDEVEDEEERIVTLSLG